jgi:hypothetical protein
VETLRDNIRTSMADKGKNATGETARTLDVIARNVGADGGEAALEANANWKWVGNGRGPGRMPPIGPIQAWIDAKGLELSAWAVAGKIKREGSRDFRLGRPNIFIEEIRGWEEIELPRVDAKLTDLLAGRVVETINAIL